MPASSLSIAYVSTRGSVPGGRPQSEFSSARRTLCPLGWRPLPGPHSGRLSMCLPFPFVVRPPRRRWVGPLAVPEPGATRATTQQITLA